MSVTPLLSHSLSLHYQVDYTVEGWLDKNKDPLNESVVELFKKSSETLIAHLWSDYTVESGCDIHVHVHIYPYLLCLVPG